MIEGNYIVNVKCNHAFPTWLSTKDDLIGSGSYTTLRKAEQHAEALVLLIKNYHNDLLLVNGKVIDKDTHGRVSYLKANFKHLSKNEARVDRAQKVLEHGVAVRVLSFTLPSVCFLGETN